MVRSGQKICFKFLFYLSLACTIQHSRCRKTVDVIQIEQIYEARRDATTNPLDHVFELCSYSWSLLPGQAYKCKIYYRPFVPFAVNVDYFTIMDSAGERAEIQVRGMCIGISLINDRRSRKRSFVIKAHSSNSESSR